MREKIFCTGPTKAAKAGQIMMTFTLFRVVSFLFVKQVEALSNLAVEQILLLILVPLLQWPYGFVFNCNMFILWFKNLNVYATQNKDDKISIVIIMFYNLADGQQTEQIIWKDIADNEEKSNLSEFMKIQNTVINPFHSRLYTRRRNYKAINIK